jgi:hypothetical protein
LCGVWACPRKSHLAISLRSTGTWSRITFRRRR